MFSAPPDEDGSTRNSSNPVNKLVHGILSHDTNIMLAAIISLLVVILFVLLLQVYAKWFLVQTRTSSGSSVSVPQVLLGGTTLHHFHSTASDSTTSATSLTKGLDSLVISSIPQFAYKSDEHGLIDQCAICLSVFEDEEMGRRLPRCSHSFHVDCIDMWLDSHSTCPICRCPVLLFQDKILEFNPSPSDEVVDQDISEIMYSETQLNDDETSRLEITVDHIPNAENENSGSTVDTVLSSSSLSSHVRLPVTVTDSVKRMMSRNRSERKVHPSTSDFESSVS